MTGSDRKEKIVLFFLLGLVGIVLFVTAIRGPFIIDEINYLVTVVGLRHGTLFVPGTEGLTPSRELVAFDPDAQKRIVTATPVFSVVPPLYAPIALPFLLLGWHGLVLLNILSYLIAAFVAFTFLRSYATDLQTRWIGIALALLGGFGIEYAQGVWPHMLSVALVVSAVYAASRVWRNESVGMALVSGLIIGTASGIRGQDIMFAGGIGLTMLLFSRRRILSSSLFAAGAALPLSIIASMYYLTQGLWHPFPKVIAYSSQVSQGTVHGSIFNPVKAFWIRIVDYSAQPEFTDPILSVLYKKDPLSGAMLITGIVKKSLLQSSPWIAVALVVLAFVWISGSSFKDEARKTLRALSLITFPMILVIVMTGVGRSDGLAYNQRYFLEIVPLLAIGLLIALDEMKSRVPLVLSGLLGAGFIYAIVLALPSRTLYQMALVNVPLALALFFLVGWMFRGSVRVRFLMPVALGLCLGWSAFVHVLDDLPASRARRSRNAALVSELESALPNHSAIFTYGGWRDAAGAVMLTRDVVVLDVGADDGNDCGILASELEGRRRSLYVLGDVFPPGAVQRITGGDTLVLKFSRPVPLFELEKKTSIAK